MPGITVVVPSWNRRDLLVGLIRRLRAQTCPITEIVVVDNGSCDGSAQAASGLGARVVEMGRNAGFSCAVNRGIEETRTDLVAIVNNDVEPSADWLERLVWAMEGPDVCFATGKLLSKSDPRMLDGTYDTISRGACSWRAGGGRPDGPAWDRASTISFAPFTAAVFRTDLFRKVGLLDERFESYLEDVDFCLRCAAQGFRGVYVPDATALHEGSATLGRWHRDTVRRISRNQVLLVAKHFPPRYLLRNAWPILAGQGLWGALALVHGRLLSLLRGKLEGLMMFRVARRESGGGTSRENVPAVLSESEAEIARLQRETGYDLYWRLYFALTSWS